MAKQKTVTFDDRFVAGKLRMRRKAEGSLAEVSKGSGVSARTMGRAERGIAVNFTSAILTANELRLFPIGVFDVRDPEIKKILKYMRVVSYGGHAKGWNDYFASICVREEKAA